MFELTGDISLAQLQAALQTTPETAALPPLERRILLSHALGLDRIGLITQDQRILSQAELAQINSLFARRLAGEPIAYILGQREFFGLSLRVTPDVLIPRPDTELLVELALQMAAQGARIVDLGTGSGAIAIAVAHQRPDMEVTALDMSEAALAIARDNAARHLARPITFLQSDWYQALPVGSLFDGIVSNPPYIEAHDVHLSQGDLRFEPISALTDHADGLQALRQIIAGAPQYLRAGGFLLMEHGYDQAEKVRSLLSQAGWQEVQSWRDLAGIERVSGGRLPK